jgi:hypothetical protein
MKNLVYHLPLDIQEIIFKKKYELEFKEKYMPVIAELKAFKRPKWSCDRWVQKKFPYDCDRYDDKRILKHILCFYEKRLFTFERGGVFYRDEYVEYSTYLERDFEESLKMRLGDKR